MARDGIFFRRHGHIRPRFHTPILAIAVQGVWASLLASTGNFQQLFTYVIFTTWIFYGLTVASVIALRIRKPDLERSFRVAAYPRLPFLFAVAAVGIALSTIPNDPIHAGFGIAMILTGCPLYLLSRAAKMPAGQS